MGGCVKGARDTGRKSGTRERKPSVFAAAKPIGVGGWDSVGGLRFRIWGFCLGARVQGVEFTVRLEGGRVRG